MVASSSSKEQPQVQEPKSAQQKMEVLRPDNKFHVLGVTGPGMMIDAELHHVHSFEFDLDKRVISITHGDNKTITEIDANALTSLTLAIKDKEFDLSLTSQKPVPNSEIGSIPVGTKDAFQRGPILSEPMYEGSEVPPQERNKK